MKNNFSCPSLLVLFISLTFLACSGNEQQSKSDKHGVQQTTTIDLWNGNRSEARQVYEPKVLKAILEATEAKWGPWEIVENLDEYPGAEESLLFTDKGHDLFVTIAGNQKFTDGDMIVIPHLLTKNLLGYRCQTRRPQSHPSENNTKYNFSCIY